MRDARSGAALAPILILALIGRRKKGKIMKEFNVSKVRFWRTWMNTRFCYVFVLKAVKLILPIQRVTILHR
jgi:hypothetical protein